MYKIIFYRMTSTNVFNPNFEEIAFSVAIEDENRYNGPNSIMEHAREMPDVVHIQPPPVFQGERLYLEAETIEEAHYICMRFGYTISGLGKGMEDSRYAEYRGLHECGTLEDEYEKALGKKNVKSA